jgi:CRISP-associated protein Cas1
MIKRTIEISSDAAARLRIQRDQLVIEREGAEPATVPCEDIGILLIDQQRVLYSHAVMTRLMEKGACVVLCGDDHLPCGLVLPLEGNELLTQRLRAQINVSRPLEKRLWQQIIKAKVAAQATALETAGDRRQRAASPLSGMEQICGDTTAAVRRLRNMIAEVQSGDATNIEGQAARIYWEGLMGEGFKRSQGGPWPNPILNYGYAIVRAAVARAIAGAGLHPSFGVHHHNRGNAFCLADDLIEPLRPLVDATVVGLMEAGHTAVTPTTKRFLLGLLTYEIQVGDQKGPLMVQLHRVAAGFWKCFEENRTDIELPHYTVDKLMNPSLYADS